MAKDNSQRGEKISSGLGSSSSRADQIPTAGVRRFQLQSREEQLAQARANRALAENTRQKIADEILEATRGVCDRLIAEGEQTLQNARKLEAEAKVRQQEAQAELEKAEAIRAEAQVYAEKVKTEAQEQLEESRNVRREADKYRENVISEAKEQGQQILSLARSTAEQECNELKHRASIEAQRIITEAELIEAAAQEEMEAQRIYAEAARLEAESLEVLAQVRAKTEESVEMLLNPNTEPEFQSNPAKKPRARKSKVVSAK